MAEKTVRSFVESVGRENLMKHTGVKPRMIRHVAQTGVMPAKWYAGAVKAAEDAGQEPPAVALFDFKRGADSGKT